MWRFLVLGALGLEACEPADPCGDYVDYMCVCHADDEDADCDTLRVTYASADPDVQDECAVLLDAQLQEDEDAGLECAW
jgi:hypothetical protein